MAVALQSSCTGTQIVTIAENLIESTVFYTMDCREWNRTDTAQKTWVKFKVHFPRAFREHRDQSKQAQNIGYGHANTQNPANAAIFDEMTQDHSHALTNLATATQLDRITFANMSKTITDLTLQLKQANAKLTEAQSSIATLTAKLSQTWTRPNRPPTIPPEPIGMTLTEKDGYCWIHGYKMKKGHNRTTCRF